MFGVCKLFGTGVIPWSPLARGYMTRPWRDQDSTKRAKTDPNFAKFVGLGNPAEEDALHKINEAYALSLNLFLIRWRRDVPS